MTPTVAVLSALAAIVALGWLGHRGASLVGQPAVVGELVLGIAAGPVVAALSSAAPEFRHYALPAVNGLADAGLVLFMFTIGLEAGRPTGSTNARTLLGVSVGSAVLPFAAGMLVAATEPGYSSPVFVGLAFAVTALPVLARIVAQHHLTDSPEGRIALLAAAIIDAATWIAVTIVIGLSRPDTGWAALLIVPLIAVMILLGRRVAGPRLAGTTIDGARLTLIIFGLLAVSTFTEAIGSHFIIGAFVFGLAMPRHGFAVRRAELIAKITPLTNSVLLPAFFIVTGTQVTLSTMTGAQLLLTVLAVVCAVGAKLAGAFLGAYATGTSAATASSVAILMNARGLTELVVLEVGRQAKMLDSSWYSIMVVVALVTTAITGPALALLYRRIRPPSLAITK